MIAPVAPVLQGHQVVIATDNTTVVILYQKAEGTQSYSLLCLVAISVATLTGHSHDRRWPVHAQSADNHRMKSQNSGSDLQVVGSPHGGHVRDSPQHSCLLFWSPTHWQRKRYNNLCRDGQCTYFLLFPY